MKMSRLLGVAAALLLGSHPVLAADKAIAVSPVAARWDGCHIGGTMGVTAAHADIVNRPAPSLIQAAIDNTETLSPAQLASLTYFTSANGTGLSGGVGLGCDWNAAPSLIVGIEGDFNGSTLSLITMNTYPDNELALRYGHSDTSSLSSRWFATVRGRAGWDAGTWMPYVTGGLAIAEVRSNLVMNYNGPDFVWTGDESQIRFGYTVGGGIQLALDAHWSAKAEYLYIDLGSFSFEHPGNNAPGAAYQTDVRFREHLARFGLDYKF